MRAPPATAATPAASRSGEPGGAIDPSVADMSLTFFRIAVSILPGFRLVPVFATELGFKLVGDFERAHTFALVTPFELRPGFTLVRAFALALCAFFFVLIR